MGVVGGKKVAGLDGLGEWVSGGRLTAGGGEVAGRACPAPTGGRKGARVLDGNGQAEGSRPLPTMWKVRGWSWESVRAGHARPLRGGAKKKAGAGINFQRVSLSPNLYTSVTCFPLM